MQKVNSKVLSINGKLKFEENLFRHNSNQLNILDCKLFIVLSRRFKDHSTKKILIQYMKFDRSVLLWF
jgi:hypothetical protein